MKRRIYFGFVAMMIIIAFTSSMALAAPSLTLTSNITGTTAYDSGNITATIRAEVKNSKGQSDFKYKSPVIGSDSVSANVDWAQATAWYNPSTTAGASLNIDLNGAPAGSSAWQSFTYGAFGFKLNSLNVTRTVDFNISAEKDAAGGSENGRVGIFIDAWEYDGGGFDLEPDLEFTYTPYVYSTAQGTNIPMVYSSVDGTPYAWFFHYTADDLIALGGSDTLTAYFNFKPGTHAGMYEVMHCGAFVDGSAKVPIPGALWLLGSGLVGLYGVRKKSKSYSGRNRA